MDRNGDANGTPGAAEGADLEPALPDAFEIADRSSLWGQRMHMRLIVFELGLLIIGAFAGLFDLHNVRDIEIPQLIGAVLFVAALAIRAFRSSERFERRWFEGRAAAESVKSLAWRYAVRGDPFPSSLGSQAADQEFVARLREIVERSVAPATLQQRPIARPVTDWMRSTRETTLRERKSAYCRHRIEEQRAWYGAKAFLNGQAHRRWNLLLILLELCGFGVGLTQALGALGGRSVSALAMMAAIVAAITAWTQARQFGSLAAAYTQAEQELMLISQLVDQPHTEGEWAAFVESAETAISREHRMWQTSRALV